LQLVAAAAGGLLAVVIFDLELALDVVLPVLFLVTWLATRSRTFMLQPRTFPPIWVDALFFAAMLLPALVG
jgi:hypothetical protein